MKTHSRTWDIVMLVIGVISLVLGVMEIFVRNVTAITTFWSIALGLLLIWQGYQGLSAARKSG